MTQINDRMTALLGQVRFNAEGLVPVIVQQFDSGEVLMMAWMNSEALMQTLNGDRAVYWSRSRKALWRKGDSSGHLQQVKTLWIDCDGDTLLLKVDQKGAACHTGQHNCFFQKAENGNWVEAASFPSEK